MNAVLTATGLSARHADRLIFSAADLMAWPGKVIGLVGANGAEKSSLLRMLAGLDDGARCRTCVANPATATVGHLPQEPERRAGESVLAFIGRRSAGADFWRASWLICVEPRHAILPVSAVVLGALVARTHGQPPVQSDGCLLQPTRQFRCPPFGTCGRCAIVRAASTCTAAD